MDLIRNGGTGIRSFIQVARIPDTMHRRFNTIGSRFALEIGAILRYARRRRDVEQGTHQYLTAHLAIGAIWAIWFIRILFHLPDLMMIRIPIARAKATTL
jgi:hypothetical protein